MSVLVVTGTGTEVGKTVVCAAMAALAAAGGRSIAVLKPAQTGLRAGEPGDIDVVRRLAPAATVAELARYPEPLAPATAARRSGISPVHTAEIVRAAAELDASHDQVLLEGAGGLLVRFDDSGGTLADAAAQLAAPVLVVAPSGLGTLGVTALTAEVAAGRGLTLAGVVIGSWPARPGLADVCNATDLPAVAAAPLLGALEAGLDAADPAGFRAAAGRGLAPALGGTFDAEAFAAAACATLDAAASDAAAGSAR